MKLYIVKTLNGTFKPAYDSDYEQVKKIKAGEILTCEIKQPRNGAFHRKFMALINMVFQNQERYNNFDLLRKHLIIAAGYYDTTYTLEGVEIPEAKSIAFANMSEDEFQGLYNAVIDTIIKYFHFERQDIIDNVEQFF